MPMRLFQSRAFAHHWLAGAQLPAYEGGGQQETRSERHDTMADIGRLGAFAGISVLAMVHQVRSA